MKKEKEEKSSILSTLRVMELYETVQFPSTRCSYVKSACVTFGFQWGKKFTTHVVREENIIEVTRVE